MGHSRHSVPAPLAAVAALSAVLPLALSGCAASAAPEAAGTVRALHAAVERGDGAAACALLTPEAERAAASAAAGCPEGVLQAGLEIGAVRTTEVWGDAALVRTANDTVFLTLFPSGWEVGAAGCRSRAPQPYECAIEG